MDSDKILSGVAQIIPEGFVDIIRRVTPGVVLSILINFLTGLPDIKIESVTVGGFLLFLLVSYATGLLIDALTDWLARGYFTWFAWSGELAKEPTDAIPAAPDRKDIRTPDLIRGALDRKDIGSPESWKWWQWGRWKRWPIPGLLYAKITGTNPRAAIILPKLVAEEGLLRNLTGGLFVVLVMLILVGTNVLPFASKPIEHFGTLFALVFACMLLAFWASLYRAKRTVIRTLEWLPVANLPGKDDGKTDPPAEDGGEIDSGRCRRRRAQLRIDQVIKAVVFDMGGVLAYDVWEHLLLDKREPSNPDQPVGIAALYCLQGSDVERVGRKLWDIYSRPGATLPSGDVDLEGHYWTAFVQELKEQLPASISASDLRNRTDLFIKAVNEPAMESLLTYLQSKNIRLVICSDNTEFWFRRQMVKLGLHRYFSPRDCFVSYSVGFSKDSPGFETFHAISEALGIEKSSCLFIDDRKKNVELALTYGFTPILFPSHSPKGFDYLKAILSQMI